MSKFKKKKVRSEGELPSSTITWYPGHMAKALRKVKESMKKVDIIVELRDARLPLSTGNNSIIEVIGEKCRLVVLNKINLADPLKLKMWEDFFAKESVPYLLLNSFDNKSLNTLVPKARESLMNKRPTFTNQSSMKMMIVGLPNTGKSTIINHLAGKKVTRAADRPGLTQSQQWVKIGNKVELLDTPGIMAPKIATDEQGYWLSSIHAIKDEIVGIDTICFFFVKFMIENYPKRIEKFYEIDSRDDSLELIESVAKRRNFILSGNRVDLERSYRTIMSDFRLGRFGQVTFETP